MLRDKIQAKHGSIHAFCRRMAGQLNRSTVYMVCAGSYPGNGARQATRIEEALETGETREGAIMKAIKKAACERCATPSPCGRCDELFWAQARAVVRITR